MTPSTALTFSSTCAGSHCAAGQAGAVSVMRTPTDGVAIDDDLVDQTEIVDVDRDLGVEDGLDRRDDLWLERGGLLGDRAPCPPS